MFTKKNYNPDLFSYVAGVSGFNFGQIENSFFPEIDKPALIVVGITIGAIVIFNFVYQHIKDRITKSNESKK